MPAHERTRYKDKFVALPAAVSCPESNFHFIEEVDEEAEMAASEGEGAIEPTHPRLAEVRGRVFFSLLFLGTGAHPCLKRFRIFVVEVFLFFF